MAREFGPLLQIVAFPSNDFGEQEKNDDAAIAGFCRVQFNLGFPIAKKSVVKKSPDQNIVFQWLTSKGKNGWNDHAPDWNFSKYLVDGNGTLTHYFGPAVSPLSDTVKKAIAES